MHKRSYGVFWNLSSSFLLLVCLLGLGWDGLGYEEWARYKRVSNKIEGGGRLNGNGETKEETNGLYTLCLDRLIFFLLLQWALFKDQIGTGDTTVDVFDIVTDSFKVGSSIIRSRDEDLILGSVCHRLFDIKHWYKSMQCNTIQSISIRSSFPVLFFFRTYLSWIGPNRAKPASISFSGSSVSTMVETIAR